MDKRLWDEGQKLVIFKRRNNNRRMAVMLTQRNHFENIRFKNRTKNPYLVSRGLGFFFVAIKPGQNHSSRYELCSNL